MSAQPRPLLQREPTAETGRGWARIGASVARQWTASPWIVRVSSLCLLTFYLFAAASPLIAPYDPVRQYRSQPDCPPMALHLSPAAEHIHGWLFAYPMRMVNP